MWKDIPACGTFDRNALAAEIYKFAYLVRHHDQHERETDGAVHWNSINIMCGSVRALCQVRGREEAEGRKTPCTPRFSIKRKDPWLRLAVVRRRLRHAGRSGTIGRTEVHRTH